MAKNQKGRIGDLTAQSVENDPLWALRIALSDNPEMLAEVFSDVLGYPVPPDPQALYNEVVNYYNANGDIDPFIAATQTVPIIGEVRKSFNLGNFIGGVLEAVGSALSGGGNKGPSYEQALLMQQQQQAAAARQQMNMILLIMGGVLVLGVVLAIVLRKK